MAMEYKHSLHNGSLAAPSKEDDEAWQKLTSEQKQKVFDDAIQTGVDSRPSEKTVEDIWRDSVERLSTHV